MVQYLKKMNDEEIKLNRDNIIIYLILIFIVGSFCGWIYEEIFYFVQDNVLVKRGFLYGPYLPVYGWGALLIVLCLRSLKRRPVVLFIMIMLLTGILEYLTGIIMFGIWHKKWWDYTGLFLNIDGFVCFRSVFTFALAGFVLLYLVEPLIKKLLSSPRASHMKLICILFIIIYLIDNIFSFLIKN